MEPNSREFYKQCAFQKFCNTVLHNEACDTHRELRRHKAKEVTFSDMTLDEARQLHTFDEYFKREAAETVFEKAGKKITPKLLLEAIRTLPEEKRKAILLPLPACHVLKIFRNVIRPSVKPPVGIEVCPVRHQFFMCHTYSPIYFHIMHRLTSQLHAMKYQQHKNNFFDMFSIRSP